ncbi:hypothetical protein [Carboxylicivirga sp. RSCT41]|uniref:hypothetical protein n=1 Tax=Carboxylicivirga agarovorans TaxID=3417570 RepID=UPI003D32E294
MNKKYRVIRDLPIKNFKKSDQPKVKVFLTKLFQKNYSVSHLLSDFHNTLGGAYFSYTELKLIFGNKYNQYLQQLEELQLITVFKNYRTEYGHKLNVITPLFTLPFRYTTVEYGTKEEKILAKYYAYKKKQLGDYYWMFTSTYNISINITKKQFISLMKKKYSSYVAKKKFENKDVLPLDEYVDTQVKQIYNTIKAFNKATYREKLDYYSVDSTFGNRFYSIFTLLPNEIRADYLSDFNNQLDLKGSQVSILAKWFKNYGLTAFVDDLNNNDIYLMMKEKYDLDNRDIAKVFMFKMIFGKLFIEGKHGNKFMNKYHQIFSGMYPQEGNLIFKLKGEKNTLKKQHSILAQKLQRLETSMFSKVWCELKKNRIRFISVHDEVIVRSKDVQKTEEIMNTIISDELSGINVVINKK